MDVPQGPHGTEQQETKSPAESPAGIEPEHISSNADQNHGSPRPLAGQKRQRSPSLLRKPSQPEESWRCPSCGLLCWLCHSSFHSLPAPKSLYNDDDDDSDSSSMESTSHTQCTTTPPSKKKRKQCEAIGIEFVGPKDPGFDDEILIPCGVSLYDCLQAGVKPNVIFGSQPKPPSSRVIIRMTDKILRRVLKDFNQYKLRGYDEHTLSTICHDWIVLRDPFDDISTVDDECTTFSVRRDRWRPHKYGPPVPGETHFYDWDIEPDTTYAVAVNIFDAKHRRELRLTQWHRWLADKYSVSPYLTIEYKCSAKSGKSNDAMLQNATASVIWLYQQKQILDALSLPLDDVRHYSITIVDDIYTIMEARFQDTSYHIRKLATGLLTQSDGLRKYVAWSNAIHTWGLGTNASTFKANIEKLVERKWNTQALPT